MSQFLGMDPAAVDAKAKQLQAKSNEIEQIQTQLSSLIDGLQSVWHGADMKKFQEQYTGQFRPQLTALANGLEQLSQSARQQAQQQRATSGA